MATPSAATTSVPTSSSSPTSESSPTATGDPLASRAEAEIRVEGGPDFPLEAFGSLWMLTPDDEGSITRLDPATNEVIATIPVGTRLCQAIGATDDAIWACTRGGVVEVDPEANEVVGTVELPTAEFYGYLPFGDGALWVPSGEVTRTDQLQRIDPSTATIAATYPLEFDAQWLTYGLDAVWLTDTADGKLWRFDPETEELSEVAAGFPDPGASAIGAGSVWLAIHSAHESRPAVDETTLLRLDPATGEVQAEIATGGPMFEAMIHAADDAVWLRAPVPFVGLIDPSSNEMTEAIMANYGGGSITVAFESVWATSIEFNTVWRLSP